MGEHWLASGHQLEANLRFFSRQPHTLAHDQKYFKCFLVNRESSPDETERASGRIAVILQLVATGDWLDFDNNDAPLVEDFCVFD